MEGFTVRTGAQNMDIARVSTLLKQTYWAASRSDETIARSVAASRCAGAFDDSGAQRGFARAITDGATTCYLCDVIVDRSFRGRGAGRALVEALVNDPELAPLHWLLLTSTAAGLYEKLGFAPYGGECMHRRRKKDK